MTKIKIVSTGQLGFIETDLELAPGQDIITEVDGIIEPAIVQCSKDCPKAKASTEEIKEVKFVRIFNDEDKKTCEDLKKAAEKYLSEARNKAFRHGLEMKILSATMTFDEKKVTFYFTAQGRIDFRSLVSDMAGDFGKIIRLQQVGPRDETKIFGGFGKCGRPLCCASFISNLESITAEMAEAQEITGAKQNKLTGCCGKLMCCLSYEADSLKNFKEKATKTDKVVTVAQGEPQNDIENNKKEASA